VTRDDQPDRVARTRLRDGAHRARPAEHRGELGVAGRAPRRDLAQRAPDLRLEGCALHVERQVERVVGRGDERADLREPLAEPRAVLCDDRLREALAQLADQRVARVAQLGRADTARCRRHEQPAERRPRGGEADQLALAAAPPRAEVMPRPAPASWYARARAEARAVRRLRDRPARVSAWPKRHPLGRAYSRASRPPPA
jgi:hypothetical protein